MTATPPTRTQTERADQTRARILDVAIREFSENGLAGARIEQIAAAAGVNKALIYYYFRGKDELYTASLEAVVESVRANSLAVLEAEASAGERYLRMVLNHFDRMHSNRTFQSLMQQEMIRLHRGESNAIGPIAEKLMRPLWMRVQALVEEGMAGGELIPVQWTQMIYAGLGANVFYFLSAPMAKWSHDIDPLEPGALEFRRKAAIEYLGQTVFIDREHGARLAARVLASTPMPPSSPPGHPGFPSLHKLFAQGPVRRRSTKPGRKNRDN